MARCGHVLGRGPLTPVSHDCRTSGGPCRARLSAADPMNKSLRPASGTARYLSSTNWSPQMNVAPRIRTLVPRCACDSHPQPISGFLRTRSRRPSAPADATIEGPAWLAHRSCTSISASSFPNFKRSWMSKNNKNGERAKSHMQIFETFRNGTFGCS